MSNSDSFIDEVTEEVRRDRLYGLMRRYGWIAVLVIVLIVGGAAWREYSKAQAAAEAQAFGDAILDALEQEAPADRIAALEAVTPQDAGGQAVLDMLIAAEQANDGAPEAAAQRLQSVAGNLEAPAIYRQIAEFKALSRDDSGLTPEARREGLTALAVPGQPLNLLAQEQLALLDIEVGETGAALQRLQEIAASAEATQGLRRRAQQLIVALGGSVDG